jgi:hypothetical protein
LTLLSNRVRRVAQNKERCKMVSPQVKQIVEDVYGKSEMSVGKDLTHPDGRTVRITGGQYWGTYGVSNFWYWRPVNLDGTLGPEECGYGWL